MNEICPHCYKRLKAGLEQHLGVCRKCRDKETQEEQKTMNQQDEQSAQGAVLLDLDGVICENTFRREFGDDRDYALFGRRCGNAVAIWDFVCFARALKMDNVAIFILTARSESLRGLTLNWLKEKGVPVDELLMRPKGNKQPDYALKKTMLAKLARKYGLGREGGLLPLMAVDDDAETVKMYADANIPSFLPPNVPTGMI